MKKLLILLWASVATISISYAGVIEQTGPMPIIIDHTKVKDNVVYLMASAARRPSSTSVKTFSQPKHAWLQSIDSSEPLEWQVKSDVDNSYFVTTLLKPLRDNQSFELEVIGTSSSLKYTISKAGWQRHLSGIITIPAGVNTLRFTRTSNSGDIDLKSIELIEVDKKQAYDQRVAQFKSDTSEFSQYKYGLMFQYGAWGYPQNGPEKSLNAQADDFDVARFVNMVTETGAQYVIWSATWWTYEINAPISALEQLLGNSDRTSMRDLIGDVADALDREGIGFYLYYHTGQDSHLGYNSTDWWQLNEWPSEFMYSGTGDRATFFDYWKTVIGEMGERYGERLDGWFFDDGLVYYPAPFEALGEAAKKGNPNRLISYNPWIIAHYTDFEDLSFGEECKAEGAPIGGSGVYTTTGDLGLQGHCMLRMENDWGIRFANQAIGTPRFTVDSAYSTVVDHSQRKVPTSFNLMMYEDGTVSPDSLRVLTGLKARLFNEQNDVVLNNDNQSIGYIGNWQESNDRGAGDFGDDVHYTGENGASFEFKFVGSDISIIGPKSHSQGKIAVSLDGVSQGVVNTYQSGYHPQKVIFALNGLEQKEHTIKLTKLDGNWMQLDAIKYTNQPVLLNNDNNEFLYAGSWFTSSNRGLSDYLDDVAYTRVNGDYYELTFEGTGIEIISEVNSDQGKMDVTLDNQATVRVDTYATSRESGKVVYSVNELSRGIHTIQVKKVDGQYMLVDALKIYK